MAVGDCSVTERRRWYPPYQTSKTVHVHEKPYKHNEDECTAPGVCSNGSVPLSHSGNVVTRIGIHTHREKLHCQRWKQKIKEVVFLNAIALRTIKTRLSLSVLSAIGLIKMMKKHEAVSIQLNRCAVFYRRPSVPPVLMARLPRLFQTCS